MKGEEQSCFSEGSFPHSGHQQRSSAGPGERPPKTHPYRALWDHLDGKEAGASPRRGEDAGVSSNSDSHANSNRICGEKTGFLMT